jgi:hypothetical protein
MRVLILSTSFMFVLGLCLVIGLKTEATVHKPRQIHKYNHSKGYLKFISLAIDLAINELMIAHQIKFDSPVTSYTPAPRNITWYACAVVSFESVRACYIHVEVSRGSQAGIEHSVSIRA